MISDLKERLNKSDLTPEEQKNVEKFIADTYRLLKESNKYAPSVLRYTPPEKNPAQKNFEQSVQQKKLTESYNNTHRHNPISAKGGSGGDIGGVACSTSYIEGLFDAPETLFEHDHCFCLPKLPDGQMPFKNSELRQILREIAIGVYTHSTVPFFSLHFNSNTDLFPIIHPVYENTLVGRVISMLDYIMKGYLNGGVFHEKFIDQWHLNPDWKSNSVSALSYMIDFEEYCKVHMKGEDKKYISTRSLEETIKKLNLDFLEEKALEVAKELGINITPESQVLNDLTGFSNSFRIIAKQKSVQKDGNVFVIDSDFDVLYTITPSTVYKEALEQHQRKYGCLPMSYLGMIQAYEISCLGIHDHMVKMPLCRHYFSMLAVINFFSGYFSTLKKHRKTPILPTCRIKHTKGSPSLFPHLPLKATREEHLQLNIHQAYKNVFTNENIFLQTLFSNFYNQLLQSSDQNITDLPKDGKQKLINFLTSEFKKNIFKKCSVPLRRYISTSKEFEREVEKICLLQSEQFVDEVLKLFRRQVNFLLAEARQCGMSAQDLIKKDKIRSQIIEEYFKAILESIPDKVKNITAKKCTYRLMQTVSEINAQEVERGKKIVGGCGMSLNLHKIQTSPKAAIILQNNWSQISTLAFETWSNVLSDDFDLTNDAMFRIAFEDVPAWVEDDYQWMDSYLLMPSEGTEKQIDDRLKIKEAMSNKDENQFLLLVNQAADIANMKDRYGRTLMHLAAGLKDSSYLKILSKKASVHLCYDMHGYFPIHYAAMNGSLESLEYLLKMDKRGQTINALSKNRSTPLIVAIQHQQLDAMCFLLKKRARLTSIVEAYNPLHCALHQGNLELIYAFLDFIPPASECINESSEDEGTPLMLACELDSLELIQILLAKGAKPDVRRKDGVTAIEVAIMRDCKPIVEYLLKYTRPNSAIKVAVQQASIEIIELLHRNIDIYSIQNAHSDTSLHMAIRSGNIPAAIFIVQNCTKKGFLDARNLEKHTALDLAISAGLWDLAEVLYEKGAKTIADFQQLLRTGYHPVLQKISAQFKLSENDLQEHLLFAAQKGNYRAITEILIPRGAKIDQLQGPNGWQFLHYLAKLDGLALFRKFIKSVNLLHPLSQEEGKTLPYIAAEHGSQRILRLLLEQMKKKNISFQKQFRDRHLLYAVIEAGIFENIQMIFEICKDLSLANEILDSRHTLPVHIGSKIGSKKIVKFLVGRGANLTLADKDGYTPLDYAVRAKANKLISFILNSEQEITISVRALYEAASHQNETLLNLLMQSKKPKKLNGAMLKAVAERDTRAFLRLLKCGASLDCISPKGWTPLLIASDSGQHEIVSIILQANFLDKRVMKDGSALHLACKNGHAECVKLLLKAGFVDEINQNGKTGLDLADGHHGIFAIYKNQEKKYQSNINTFVNALEEDNVDEMEIVLKKLPLNQSILVQSGLSKIWGTPLQLLLRMGEGKKVLNCVHEVLKRKELLPNIQDSNGDTLAHLMVSSSLILPTHLEINFAIKNHQGQTVLHVASAKSNIKNLETLYCIPNAPIDIESIDKFGRTALFYAIEGNKEDNILFLIEKGASLRHKDHCLVTPLLYACATGIIATVKILLSNAADPNQTGTIEKITPLHASLALQNDEMTRYLLFHGASCDVVSANGTHAIHIAAEKGKINFLRLLSAKGYSLNIKDKKGSQAIHFAAAAGKTNIVSTIIFAEENSIDMPMYFPEKDNKEIHKKSSRNGTTPLHMALLSGQIDTAKYLLNRDANIEAKTTLGRQALAFASESAPKHVFELLFKYNLSMNSNALLSALGAAISKDNIEAMRMLYERGVTVNADIEEGCTGLQFASVAGALSCTQWLLQNGADYLHPCSFSKFAGENALEISAANNSHAQFKLLLEYTQPDLEQINARGETLIHIAARAGNLKHLMILIMNGASIDAKNSFGYTPLHIAVKEGYVSIVQLLLACGANVSAKSFDDKYPANMAKNNDEIQKAFQKTQQAMRLFKKDESPLHFAVRSENPLAVLLLLREEDVDQQDCEGTTALHLAAKKGDPEIIQHLVRAKALVDLRDNQGKTPLFHACIAGHLLAVKALLFAGANINLKDNSEVSILQTIQKLDFPEKIELIALLTSNKRK